MAEYVRAFTTAESAQEADTLARSILEARLAAEVHIAGPIRLLRWWEDLVEETQEWELTMTTTRERLPALEKHVSKNLHPDGRPKLVSISLTYRDYELP
ncbi:divalent-cation tolerance protein CutA [Streptosporangium sp. NBC_01495]|uniref:divalent-cation tolerance protein CutA n=1 Tax=Streptosporangium sp. NBC_01495 TaxID=2903899 RepID=UPI002E316ABB|nr:divalent cation tolerance protein CutA [Streptosporangium sp. NBC_01495]